MIGTFDKGNGQFQDSAQRAATERLGVAFQCYSNQDRSNWKNLLGPRIAIAHIWNDEWESLCSAAKNAQVLLRVSTNGFADSPEPSRTLEGAFVLHLLPPTTQIETNDWVQILEVLRQPALLLELMEGRIPASLANYFTHQVTDILSALAILCQGYLAVQASPLPEESNDSPQVWKALVRMGWIDFMRHSDSRAVCQGLVKQKAEVAKQTWWRVAITGTRSDVKKQLCKELRQVRLPAELESLIDEIIPDESQADIKEELETVQLTTVSAAYLVLADRLEATA